VKTSNLLYPFISASCCMSLDWFLVRKSRLTYNAHSFKNLKLYKRYFTLCFGLKWPSSCVKKISWILNNRWWPF
jgi:hypothetical protein